MRVRAVWDEHTGYLKKVEPPERLFFFEVRYNWELLCKILEAEVPEGVESPRGNHK